MYLILLGCTVWLAMIALFFGLYYFGTPGEIDFSSSVSNAPDI